MFGARRLLRGTVKDIKTVALLTPNIGQLCFGGADRDRTGDPLLAKQVLSQLSYSPIGASSHQLPATSVLLAAGSYKLAADIGGPG